MNRHTPSSAKPNQKRHRIVLTLIASNLYPTACPAPWLTQAEAGEQLGFSRPTAERTWAFFRAWLFSEMKKELGS
jgi:hypothetical protein